MALEPGTNLGPYSVTAKIGEGGMGEVYRARDTKLDRDVALKVLPQAFTDDPDRLARFEREAKVLASLNHPNVGGIHGLEESDGVRALVLEYIDGPTLADRIAQGPIPIDEALPIAKQIAEALEAAHEASVIHRDLKPANVKLKPDGTVKVLDFGLAKAMQPDASDPKMSQSPTISLTAAATQMGMVMGTAAYMSPEQARGKPVDKRADIWSFGAVLFEMLTGQKPFPGDDVSQTLARVIDRDPEWEALPLDVPPTLVLYLRRCLEKNLKQRIPDIGAMRLAMEGAFETPVSARSESPVAPQPQVWLRPVPATAIGLALLVIGGLAVWSVTPDSALHLVRFVVTAPPSEPVLVAGSNLDLAISPDGRRVVYVAGTPRQLYVRAVDQLGGTRLGGTEGAYSPFFSADGAWIGFQSTPGGVSLKRVSVLGGPSETLCPMDAPLSGASWGDDGTIVFATRGRRGLFRVAAAGGEPEALTTPEAESGESHRWPEILPGGKAVLFTVETGTGLEDRRIALLNLETREQVPLIPIGSQPRYAATGHIVYGTDGTLNAVPFDLARLSVTGDPVPVMEGVLTKPSFGAVEFALAQDGSLVYVTGGETAGTRTLVWVDREGREQPLSAESRIYLNPRISPDGTRVALDVRDQENDIWIWDFAGEMLTRLTGDPEPDTNPVWTSDSQRVLFRSQREGTPQVFIKAADGTGTAEPLTDHPIGLRPFSVSEDGQHLVMQTPSATNTQLVRTALEGGVTEVLLDSDGVEVKGRNPALSPNGHWLAYQSVELEQPQIYVRPFPDVGASWWQISTAGGIQPAWSPNSQELFYRDPTPSLVAVPVRGEGATFTWGNPEVLFETQGYVTGQGRSYDVSAGDRFLMVKLGDETGTLPDIILVQNWFEELTRLVPTN
jgi:serine/threonine-protein kinase